MQTLHSAARDHTHLETRPSKEPSPVSNERYQKRYKVQGGTSEKSRAGVTVRTGTGHVVETDLPRAMGGIDAAAQPVETLLAALAGCTQATALFVARNLRPRRLDIDRIEFDLRAARDERGSLTLPIDSPPGVPSRLRAVTGTVRVHAARSIPISDRDLALLREQTELRCPVANMMIASGCEMDVRWVDGSADETV
jgi:putative redox protein